MNLKHFLLSACLLSLVLAGVWPRGRVPSQHETTSADQFPSDSHRITQPAIASPQERFQHEAPGPKPVTGMNAAMAWAQLFPASDLRGHTIKEVENVSIHTYWPILQK